MNLKKTLCTSILGLFSLNAQAFTVTEPTSHVQLDCVDGFEANYFVNYGYYNGINEQPTEASIVDAFGTTLMYSDPVYTFEGYWTTVFSNIKSVVHPDNVYTIKYKRNGVDVGDVEFICF